MPLPFRHAVMFLLALVQLCGAATWFSSPRGEGNGGVQLASRTVERDSQTAVQADHVSPLAVPRQLWQQCRGPRRADAGDASNVVSADVRGPLRRPWRLRNTADEVQLVTAIRPATHKPAPPARGCKRRVLMLISDTGGGHRASAEALEAMMESLRPGENDVRIVDVFTEYCRWPFNTFVSGYQIMAKNSWMWKYSYHATSIVPVMHTVNFFSNLFCKPDFERCIREHDPDLVVSLHPLTQTVPLRVLEELGGGRRQVPFATVVTDLGSAHPWWFDRRVDRCFIPSDAVRKVAIRRHLSSEQIRQHGLPVRPSFWQAPRPREELCLELGLDTTRKTVLVVGGGDGVGSLGRIVEATANELRRHIPGSAQVVAVCGKNHKLRSQLEARDWGDVHVQVRGFVSKMSDYMSCADVMITKAGPGTIAEATIRGVPTMLSSFLPGQEAGNVPFVTDNGFGEYSRRPKQIARTVRKWIQDPQQLEEMSEAARACATPEATHEIASDLLEMLK